MVKKFRFTIRDVVWLTLVVSLCLGWWLHQHRLTSENETLRSFVTWYDNVLTDTGITVKSDGSIVVEGKYLQLGDGYGNPLVRPK
jgi:hypothetical protein